MLFTEYVCTLHICINILSLSLLFSHVCCEICDTCAPRLHALSSLHVPGKEDPRVTLAFVAEDATVTYYDFMAGLPGYGSAAADPAASTDEDEEDASGSSAAD